MKKEQPLQTAVGGFVSTLLRTHFGKGPESVYVTIAAPFMTVHISGFLTPMELIFIKTK